MRERVLELMSTMFRSRMENIGTLLEMDLTLFDRDLKHRADWPSVTEYLCRLAWHEDAHAQEIARLKGRTGHCGLMEGMESYPLWFLREALLARARLVAELIDLRDVDLKKRAKPGDMSIEEMIQHCLDTEREFLVKGVKECIEYRSPTDAVFGHVRGEQGK